jgi:hypothetical protein
MKRVTLIPHRNDWAEIQRDAVTMLECHIANRGTWRPGDLERTPLTLSHIQHWLRKTGARRSGRDYARDVLRVLVEMKLLRDTGQVLRPRKQPSPEKSYWWRIFEVVPIARAKEAARWTSASLAGGSTRLRLETVSLCGWLRCQGVIRGKPKPSPGSVQEAFAIQGPP